MKLAHDTRQFIDRWQKKADSMPSDTIEQVFDRFFTVYVLYNFLYRVEDEEPYKFQDEVAAVKGVKKLIGKQMINDDPIIRAAAAKIVALIENDEFYVRGVEWDAERVQKLKSPDAGCFSKGVLEVVYRVRCNLFHGAKALNDEQKQVVLPCIEIIEQLNKALVKALSV